MRPDTSRWRDNDSYDYFDNLSPEGLAWECLRRQTPYQRQYRALTTARKETAPLPLEDQRRWGLRFPRAAELVRPRPSGLLVARSRSVRADDCGGPRPSALDVDRGPPGSRSGQGRP
ncbi:DUF6499 domain-containing protein [Enterovirga sp.]|uniref:transcriptional regulator domain-containing protein n=1 Tax=Enterovirga sp. TaxID=2026350 RepID=UPI002BF49B32|nr:DUF6499 domain-containing protein [Enterovirga sp.]HMO31008.1 DUF6499 domain-containing protein [Enterovirga sp.]